MLYHHTIFAVEYKGKFKKQNKTTLHYFLKINTFKQHILEFIKTMRLPAIHFKKQPFSVKSNKGCKIFVYREMRLMGENCGENISMGISIRPTTHL